MNRRMNGDIFLGRDKNRGLTLCAPSEPGSIAPVFYVPADKYDPGYPLC